MKRICLQTDSESFDLLAINYQLYYRSLLREESMQKSKVLRESLGKYDFSTKKRSYPDLSSFFDLDQPSCPSFPDKNFNPWVSSSVSDYLPYSKRDTVLTIDELRLLNLGPYIPSCYPQSMVLHGYLFYLTVESEAVGDLFFNWLRTPKMHRASLLIYLTDDEMPDLRIDLYDCYCVSVSEHMHAFSPMPMLQHVILSPAIICNRVVPVSQEFSSAPTPTQGAVTHLKSWHITPLQEKKTSTPPKPQPLVTAVDGKQSYALPGETVRYTVTAYNLPANQVDASQVSWQIRLPSGLAGLYQHHGDTLDLKMNQSWGGEEICVMPYLNQPDDKVSFKTKVHKFTLPMVIDRYKLPGINPEGTGLADDMAFGFGTGLAINFSPVMEKYIADFKEHGFEYAKSNHPAIFNQEKFPYGDPRSIYSVDEISKIHYKNTKTGQDVIEDNKEKTAENLKDTFKLTAQSFLATGKLDANIGRMIDRFMENTGGVYEHPDLTQAVIAHPKTDTFCKKVEDYLKSQIQQYVHTADFVKKVEDKNIYFTKDKEIVRKRKDMGKTFNKPIYNSFGDKIHGLTITLDDIWASETYLKKFDIDRNNNYTAEYEINLYDHFGLDKPDLEKFFDGLPLAEDMFTAWFCLQHLKGYRPFVTKITFTKTFKGQL